MNGRAELGILFVHGIGEQNVGETLTAYGEPLCDYLSDCLSESQPVPEGEPVVSINETILSRSDASTPAHFLAHIALPGTGNDGEKRERTWLFAESHWANSFPPPSTTNVSLWLLRVVPWACISYASRRARHQARSLVDAMKPGRRLSASGNMLTLLALSLLVFPLIPLALILQLLLIVLLVIGSVPIPVFKDYVSWVQRKLSSVIGDSYIYASSTVRRQAAITQLRADIAWAEANCQKLAIVAHSQGAALTYLALRETLPAKLKLLVTFGSGLAKLVQLMDRHGRGAVSSVAFVTLFASVQGVSLAAQALHLVPEEHLSAASYYTAGAMFVFFGLMAAGLSMYETKANVAAFGRFLELHRIHWLDIFSSSDPVPNGPLFESEEDFIESVRIWNERSMFSDHTTYQANRESFVPRVVSALVKSELTDLPIIDDTPGKDGIALKRAGKLRRLRTLGYKLTRLALASALILALFSDRFAAGLGASLGSWVNAICGTVGGQFGSQATGSCWNVSPPLAGVAAMLVAYFIATRLLRLIERAISASIVVHLPHGSDVSARHEAFMPAQILFFLFVIGFSVLSLSIHLYVSEPLPMTRWIVDVIPNMSNYVLWQGYFVGLGAAFATSIVFMLWMFRITH